MNDEFEGMGGSYVINEAGARVLIARTEEAAPALAAAEPEPPTLTEIIHQDEPADAGFFTPVAPAESTTTTE